MALSEQVSNPNIDLTPAESFAGIMLATIAVDKHISSEERQNLVVTLNRMKLFKDYPQEHIHNMVKDLLNIIKSQGTTKLLDSAIKNIPEYLYETIFIIATDLTLSDGKLANEELEVLSKLSTDLAIAQDRVDTIIEIMMIKNKG